MRNRNSRSNSAYFCIKSNKIPKNKPKQTKDLYSENYKMLMKELKKRLNRWKDIPCSRTGRINIVKTTMLPKKPTESMQALSNYQWHFSQSQKKKKKLKNLYGDTKNPNSQRNLEKEKWRAFSLPNLRLYYKATIIKTVWHWHNKYKYQCNRVENPEISPRTFSQSMTKEARIHKVGKTISSTNGAGKTGQPHVKN